MRDMQTYMWLVMFGLLIISAIVNSYVWFTLSSELLYKKKNLDICIKFTIGYFIYAFLLIAIEILFAWDYLEYAIAGLVGWFWEIMGACVLLILLYYRRNKGDFLKIASAVFICQFYLKNFTSFFETFSLKFMIGFYQSEYFLIQALMALFVQVVGPAGGLIILIILRKVEFRKHFASLFDTRKKGIITYILCFLLMCSDPVISFFYADWTNSNLYMIYAVSIGFVIILLMLFIATFETNRIKLNSQETLILQQEAYLQSLEGLQREMQAFRHDYKNMMSGLYLQANEGDIIGVQNFVKDSLQYFERNLGTEIKQVTQLNNIHNMQVKSLLMVKQIEIQEKNIDFKLEVLKQIETIGMDVEDFLRCLGILLDNAIEAACESRDKRVSLMLLNEDKEMTVVVENTFGKKPELHKIWEKGHSSKGENRGIGLSSYRQIVEQYSNTMASTSCNDSTFIQELRIRRAA